MNKWGKVLLSIILVGAMTFPGNVNAQELQKQQGTKILKGIEQNGKVYALPEAYQTIYNLVLDPMELLPRLTVFDGNGSEMLSLDYRAGNASIDVFVPIDPAGTQKKCNTYDLETGATASQSSIYTYAETGLAINQYDILEAPNITVSYDKQGKISSGYDGEFNYVYASDGKLAQTIVNGSMVGKYAGQKVIYNYEYDGNGDVIKIIEIEQYINGEQKLVGVTNFIY